MTKYARLTRVERAQIESLRWLGHTQTQIAAQPGSHQLTISRELAGLAPGAVVGSVPDPGTAPAQLHEAAVLNQPSVDDDCPQVPGPVPG